MKEGEIWLVAFYGEGHEYQGKRPAVVIQSDATLKIATVITILPFTSKVANRRGDDIWVGRSSQNGLLKDSLIKVQQIQSFDLSRFENKLGDLEPEILFQIKQYLQKHFGI